MNLLSAIGATGTNGSGPGGRRSSLLDDALPSHICAAVPQAATSASGTRSQGARRAAAATAIA